MHIDARPLQSRSLEQKRPVRSYGLFCNVKVGVQQEKGGHIFRGVYVAHEPILHLRHGLRKGRHLRPGRAPSLPRRHVSIGCFSISLCCLRGCLRLGSCLRLCGLLLCCCLLLPLL